MTGRAPADTPLPAAVAVAAREAGDALPAYVYDLGHLDAHAAAVAGAVPGGLYYAVKANPDPGVLRTLAAHVDGFEVASLGELRHVRALLPAAALIMGGPGKTDAELVAAVGHAERIHVESLAELHRLDAAARGAGTSAAVSLRVNVPAPAGASAVLRMGGAASPFGMDPEEADACAAVVTALPGVRLAGIHGHLASGLDAAGCAAQARAVLGWARGFAARHRIGLQDVNVGGGMTVDYRRPGERFDWAGYGRLLAEAAGTTPVRIEPGRALTAYSGWYATRVLDLKCSRGEWFAVCLGGTHHLRTPAAKGHDQPLAVLPDAGPGERTGTDAPVTFVGQLCTPKDVLARQVRGGRVRTGDIVVFALAGAYAHNISHRHFLMHPEPAVLHVGSPHGRRDRRARAGGSGADQR